MVIALTVSGCGKKTTTNTNTAASTNTINQVSTRAPSITYETYTNHGTFYTFDIAKEWTTIAPAEIEKSITEEQRNGYEIVYYSSNADATALAVSEKNSPNLFTIQQIVADDLSMATKNPNATVIAQHTNQTDARTELQVVSGGNTYIVYSRYMIIKSTAAETTWALMEVTVPIVRTTQYSGIVSHLLDSLQPVTAQ